MLRGSALFALAVTLNAGIGFAGSAGAAPLTLSSPAFEDAAVLPLKYAGGAQCGSTSRGGNVSPPLAWSDPPAGTRSFVIALLDADGNRGLSTVHWLAYGIPATRSRVAEGEGGPTPAPDLIEGKNSRGTIGYSGPCGPPTDAPHHYVIELMALDLAPDALPPGLDREQLYPLIKGHSLQPASLVVRYRREP